MAYAKVILTCFAFEFIALGYLHDHQSDSLWLETIIHAFTIGVALMLSFVVWIYPEHQRDRKVGEDEAQFMQSLLNAIPAPVFYKDENGNYLGCNKHLERHLGLKKEAIVGKTVFDILPKDLAQIHHDSDLSLMLFGDDQVYESISYNADGAKRDILFHKAVFRRSSGEAAGIIGILVDISERKELEQRLQSLATIDALTGIPNRRELDHRLEQALLRNERTGEKVALLFIDLDGFKDVNDLYGHEAGDEVLRQIGTRLTNLLRKSDVAGRMGGDEFAVLLDTKVSYESAATVAEKVLTELSAPFTIEDKTLSHLSASIGISVSPGDGQSLKTLLAKADKAMYRAKKNGKHQYCYARDL